jgi:transposase
MFLDRKGLRIFVYREVIDMRCGFEKLHSFCVHQMQAIMDQGHVYVFFGKNRRRMKILVYDGSGLVLIAKRIERGQFMSLSELLGRSEISQEELKLILHGSVIRKPVVDRSFVTSTPATQRESFALPKGELAVSM